ncbi:hypothetical protein ANANG_G00035630 [Anguilla anguilla]|uniref:Immunoglobulin V-set domain-containing protein n=1 Tax=Anguilla anguilla TaxID=7936 RepID=A0A0E9X2M4_ANGAN|nr:hypothetical protein ANANG_G00035630 [Anguilla anguilla]
MEVLRWTCVLGLLFTLARAARAESPVVFQSPKAISLMKVNSTAKIQCRTTLINPTGLYLKRRFSKELEVLYFSVGTSKRTVNQEYKHRLSMIGECCDYTLQLSLLGVKDSDGYYCIWSKLDEQSGGVKRYESTDTIIIIRERDPKEDCNRIHNLQQILFLLSVTAGAVVVCVFLGVLMWRCTRTKESYRPVVTNQRHHQLCPQHSDMQYIYHNN